MKRFLLSIIILAACGNSATVIDDKLPHDESEEKGIEEASLAKAEEERRAREQAAAEEDARQASREAFEEAGELFTHSLGSDLEGIREKLEEAHRLRPTDARTLFNLAVIAEAENEPEEARYYYEKILDGQPTHLRANLNLAVRDARRGDFDQAEDRLKTIDKTGIAAETDKWVHNNLIVLYREKGDIDAAVDYARGLLESEDFIRLAAFSLAHIILDQEQELDDFVEEFGPFDDFHRQTIEVVIASLETATGRLEEAQARITPLIESHAEDDDRGYSDTALVGAHVVQGRLLWERGQRTEALEAFDEAISIYRRAHEISGNSLAVEFVVEAHFMRAEERFERAIAVRFNSSDPEFLTEQATRKMEMSHEAHELYQDVILFLYEDVILLQTSSWAVASLYRMGYVFEDFAETLRESSIPEHLDAEQQELYRDLLEDHAQDFEAPAIERYEKTIIEPDFISHHSYLAAKRLFELRPDEYEEPARWPIMEPPVGAEYVTFPFERRD
jgi:tetratricopeptide (TPR) repeat protein